MSFNIKEYHQLYRQKNKGLIKLKNQLRKINKPWINSYFNAKQRCENKNNPNYFWYGAKGIRFNLTQEECQFLWTRDKADKLKFPTLDRKNNLLDYTLENCQFIENLKNSLKNRNHPRIEQYDLQGNLIKTWYSQTKAARDLKIQQSDISKMLTGKLKTAGGFIWKKSSTNSLKRI